MLRFLDKTREILDAIAKNEKEYKILQNSQKRRENVEDLILENRKDREKLFNKDKEHLGFSFNIWKN